MSDELLDKMIADRRALICASEGLINALGNWFFHMDTAAYETIPHDVTAAREAVKARIKECYGREQPVLPGLEQR